MTRSAVPRTPGIAREAPLGVGELDRIDVDGHDLVARRELHRGATGRGDAEDAPAGPERAELDRRVLVHAAEEHLARAAAARRSGRAPRRSRRRSSSRPHPGRLAETQTSTRKAKFLTTMPPGSWMMWRAQSRPLAFSVTSSSVCATAHGSGAIGAQRPQRQTDLDRPERLEEEQPDSRPEVGDRLDDLGTGAARRGAACTTAPRRATRRPRRRGSTRTAAITWTRRLSFRYEPIAH